MLVNAVADSQLISLPVYFQLTAKVLALPPSDVKRRNERIGPLFPRARAN